MDEDNKIAIDMETLVRMGNSRWQEFVRINAVGYGDEKSKDIARVVYLSGYISAWNDMREVSDGANAIEELLSRQA